MSAPAEPRDDNSAKQVNRHAEHSAHYRHNRRESRRVPFPACAARHQQVISKLLARAGKTSKRASKQTNKPSGTSGGFCGRSGSREELLQDKAWPSLSVLGPCAGTPNHAVSDASWLTGRLVGGLASGWLMSVLLILLQSLVARCPVTGRPLASRQPRPSSHNHERLRQCVVGRSAAGVQRERGLAIWATGHTINQHDGQHGSQPRSATRRRLLATEKRVVINKL